MLSKSIDRHRYALKRTVLKTYYILKIKTLDLEKRSKQYPPDFIFNLEYAYWLINEILVKTAYKLENEETDIWIPLCSQILNRQPYNYQLHLRYLCENFPSVGNILFRSPYKEGKCYSYRVAPYYFEDAIEVSEITDKKLLKYLGKQQKIKVNNAHKKHYNFLTKYFTDEKLKIDLKGSNGINFELYTRSLNYQKHILNAVTIKEIANGEFNIKHSKNDGRIHSQITRLQKQFRKFLSYDGKKLGEVDISASVPTFFYYILLNWSKEVESGHLTSIINQSTIYYRHYMFIKEFVSVDNSELSLFGELLLSGQFYNHFIEGMHSIHYFDESLKKDQYYLQNVRELFNREFDGDLEDLRAVIKNRFLSMFNAVPSHYLNEEAEFNMHFPSLLNWIKEFKKVNHRYFSYLTLQTESHFMLNVVARQLNRKYRGIIPIFTLHDCLITTEDNLNLVEDFMKKCLTENLGFTPKMKMKVF